MDCTYPNCTCTNMLTNCKAHESGPLEDSHGPVAGGILKPSEASAMESIETGGGAPPVLAPVVSPEVAHDLAKVFDGEREVPLASSVNPCCGDFDTCTAPCMIRMVQWGEPRVTHLLHGHPAIWCVVCDHPHYLDERWKFNGDFDKPSFLPAAPGTPHSYLSYTHESPHYIIKRKDKMKVGGEPYATFEEADRARPNDKWVVEKVPGGKRKVICHSHIIDGVMRVLGDTPGPHAGKNVPLPRWFLNADGRSYRKA
jgi:hypothetical protein